MLLPTLAANLQDELNEVEPGLSEADQCGE